MGRLHLPLQLGAKTSARRVQGRGKTVQTIKKTVLNMTSPEFSIFLCLELLNLWLHSFMARECGKKCGNSHEGDSYTVLDTARCRSFQSSAAVYLCELPFFQLCVDYENAARVRWIDWRKLHPTAFG